MKTLKVVILTALISAGLQSGAFAAGGAAPSVGETVDVATAQEQVAETSAGVDQIAPTDPTDGVETGASSEPLGLPDAGNLGPRRIREGMAVYQNESDGYSVAVNPFDGGTQVLTVLGNSDAPTSFTYGMASTGEEVVVDEDGGATVINTTTGETVSVIEKPWAVDANGADVPTRYVTDGTNLIQVVDHKSAGVAYPVTADPRIFRCDGWTHTCVKFTKSETKKISKKAEEGTAAAIFAGAMCAVILGAGTAAAVCIAAVALVSGKLKKSFRAAAKNGKCIEAHFLGAFGTLTRWKTEKC